ncbi:MAG: ACT domain-containing protein [Clostridia bacterium]|nr:ACT domain-containing protein [Clostridia bacterium]MBQ8924900.1 ACT domain-containing protein [Clostridia bacterium]
MELKKLSGILAEHRIGLFAVSTYNTDYILVKQSSNDRKERQDGLFPGPYGPDGGEGCLRPRQRKMDVR